MDVLSRTYSNFMSSVSIMKKNWVNTLLIIILDGIFLKFLFDLMVIGSEMILPRLDKVATILSENPALLSAGLGSDLPFGVSQSAFMTFKENINMMFSLFGLYILALFALTALFFGTSWYFSSRCFKKIGYWEYMLGFVKVYAAYYLFAAAVSVLSVMISYSTFFRSESLINNFLALILAVTVFFMLISLGFVHRYGFKKVFRKTFEIVRGRFPDVLVMYLVIFVIFIFIDQLSRLISYAANSKVMLIVWFVIVLLMVLKAVAFSRIFIAKTVNKK